MTSAFNCFPVTYSGRMFGSVALSGLALLSAACGGGETSTASSVTALQPVTSTPTPTSSASALGYKPDTWAQQVSVSVRFAGQAAFASADTTPAQMSTDLVRGNLVTRRFEKPIGGNLWLVGMATNGFADGKERASYVIENRTPGVFGQAPAPVTYTIRIADPMTGVNVEKTIGAATPHGAWQRWRIQSRDWPRKPLSYIETAVARGWILKHRYNPYVNEGSLANMEHPSVNEPLSDLGFIRAFGTTGGRSEIGLNHEWFGRAVRKYYEGKQSEAETWMNSAMLAAETHAAMPTHVRNDAGRIVTPRMPGFANVGLKDTYGHGNGTSQEVDYLYNNTTGWQMDKAHRGNAVWAKIVMQGGAQEADPFLIEEQQFLAAATLNQSWVDYRGPDGKLFRFWTRVMAWAMRDFAQAEAATPAETPEWLLGKGFFQPNLADIKATLAERFSTGPGKIFGTTHPAKYFSKTTDKISNVEDYNAFSLMHLYRLTGDTDWLRLAHFFIERKIAGNYNAAPLYHRDYIYPVKADGPVLYSSWEEYHAAKGHTSDPNVQWYRFDRPFADGNSSADVAMQNYDALKMARDSGAGSAAIDRAISILEAQYAGNSQGAHTRQSQDQFAIEYSPVTQR